MKIKSSKHKSSSNFGLSSIYKKTKNQVKKDHFSNDNIGGAAIRFAQNKGLQTISRFAHELNLNDIKQKGKSQNERMLNLSDGTAFLIAINQNIYQPSDAYVAKAALRKAITKNLEEKYPGEEICWRESVGLAEAGDGYYATVPVFRSHGASIGVGFGFSAGIILRYRTSQAIVNNQSLGERLALPFTAIDAKEMQAGQEFELCGQGKLRLDFQIAARYGAGATLAIAGAQLGGGLVGTAAAEYSINIMSLDGKNNFRVTIRKIDQETLTGNVNAMLGLIFPPNGFFKGNYGAPEIGTGLIKYFVEHKGSPTEESYINDYTTLCLMASFGHTRKSTHICSYDLDLSNPRAAEAYEDLVRLDPKLASELALANDGVVKVDFTETQQANKAILRLSLLGEKLFLAEALSQKSHGKLIDENGSHHIYRDRGYKKHKENWLTGHSDTLWEAVEITKDQEEPRIYYHFNYQKNDLFTRQSKINEFFGFADSLGIKHAEESDKYVINLPSYEKLFSNADDSKLEVDIYFSSEGVERIREASEEQIILAYLSSWAELNTKLSGHPWLEKGHIYKEQNLEIFKLYAYIKRYPGQNIFNNKFLRVLKRNYFTLNKRNLREDYKALRRARRFAKLTRHLVAKEQKRDKVGKFFASIDRGKWGHFPVVIPALALLAGRDNVLVHTLSASGGGIMLKSIDEGALTHPRNELIKACMREPKPRGLSDSELLEESI